MVRKTETERLEPTLIIEISRNLLPRWDTRPFEWMTVEWEAAMNRLAPTLP